MLSTLTFVSTTCRRTSGSCFPRRLVSFPSSSEESTTSKSFLTTRTSTLSIRARARWLKRWSTWAKTRTTLQPIWTGEIDIRYRCKSGRASCVKLWLKNCRKGSTKITSRNFQTSSRQISSKTLQTSYQKTITKLVQFSWLRRVFVPLGLTSTLQIIILKTKSVKMKRKSKWDGATKVLKICKLNQKPS